MNHKRYKNDKKLMETDKLIFNLYGSTKSKYSQCNIEEKQRTKIKTNKNE